MDSSSRRHWMACLAALSLMGCATLQDFNYECTQKWRTECAWLEYWWCRPAWTGSDYKKGWQAGYLDVITGGDGCPPLVAPHEYWRPSQILEDCDQGRHDWYVGFQDGAMMAKQLPDTHYVKLWNPPPVGYAVVAPVDPAVPVVSPPRVAPGSQSGPELDPDLPPMPEIQPLPEPQRMPVPPQNEALPPLSNNLPAFPASYEVSTAGSGPQAFPTF